MKIKLIIVDVFDEKASAAAPEYFITKGHIGFWQYSPLSSAKTVFTDFDKG